MAFPLQVYLFSYLFTSTQLHVSKFIHQLREDAQFLLEMTIFSSLIEVH